MALPPYARELWAVMYGTIQEVDALYAGLARDVARIVEALPDGPLTAAQRRTLLERIDALLERRFGLTQGMALRSELFGVLTRATDMAAEAPFRRLLDELAREANRRDPELWRRIHATLMAGGNGPEDRFAAVYAALNGPAAEKQRFLRAGLMDPQRRWVDGRGHRLSDRVWRTGRELRDQIDQEIRAAIKAGDGPVTLAKRLERYLNPDHAPQRYLKNGRIVRRNTTTAGGGGHGSYPARRLARTELQRVNHAATDQLAQSDVPGLIGTCWRLSAQHPKRDICDELASRDVGLGAGVYPPGAFPTIPHPQCMCAAVPVLKSREEVLDELVARYGRAERGQPGEVSPYNPLARRGPNGIWNEDTLPVTDWEAPEQRVVLPTSVQQTIGFDTPVLRWDREKFEKLRDRPEEMAIIPDLPRYLESWRYIGEEVSHPGHYRIIFQDDGGRWHALTVGPLLGSNNAVTMFGSRRSGFVRNRLAGMTNTRKRRT